VFAVALSVCDPAIGATVFHVLRSEVWGWVGMYLEFLATDTALFLRKGEIRWRWFGCDGRFQDRFFCLRLLHRP
jgi:hypothetical protein